MFRGQGHVQGEKGRVLGSLFCIRASLKRDCFCCESFSFLLEKYASSIACRELAAELGEASGFILLWGSIKSSECI